MYCNRGSLAAGGTVLQYSLEGSRFVLQYKLYCEPGLGLCRDTARAGRAGGRKQALAGAGRAGAGRAGGARRRGARGRRLGAQSAHWECHGMGARSAGWRASKRTRGLAAGRAGGRHAAA